MTQTAGNLSARLADRVPAYYPDLAVRAATVERVRDRVLPAPGWRTPRTFRALLHLGGGGTLVRLLHAKTGPHVAREYERLTGLWQQGFGRVGPFRIPQPLDLMTESDTLVTEHVSGRRLLARLALSLLVGGRRLGRWRRRRMIHVAEWLARFQRATRGGDRTTLAAYVDAIAPKVARVPGLPDGLYPHLRNEVHRNRWGRRPVMQAAVHKDFSARNVLYDARRVTVVDWEGGSAWPDVRTGPVFLDALTFSTNVLALARLPGVAWDRARRAADEFLDVYRRRARPPLAAELVRLAERVFFLEYLADYASGRHALSPKRGRAADRFARRLVRCLDDGGLRQ